AARVAVELRHQHAVEVESLFEGGGDVDGLLAGHRIQDEHDRLRAYDLADAHELVHQLLVDLQATGRVDDHRVAVLGARALEPRASGLDRVGGVRAIDGD